jgi:hypothetical protein
VQELERILMDLYVWIIICNKKKTLRDIMDSKDAAAIKLNIVSE